MSEVESSEFFEAAPNYCVHLSEARLQKQLTLEQVSEKLKVPVSYLQALEDGAIDRLPNIAFARGYLRAYARLLELDPDQLVAEFNEVCTEQEPVVASIDRIPHPEHARSPYPKLIIWVFVLVVAGSSVWWWQFQTGAGVDALSENPQPAAAKTEQKPEPEIAIQPESQAAPIIEPLASDSAGPEMELPVDEAEPVYLSEEEIERLAKQLDSEETAAETVVTASSPAVTRSLLQLSFSAECWLSIETIDGSVIFADLMQPGETLERELDTLPVKLLVGQVDAVAVARFSGRELRLADHARQGVARLTLE